MHIAAGIPPFVGREHELRTLESAFSQAKRGSGRLVLLSGDPGAGKTLLATRFSERARDGVVLWGRCWKGEGVPAFWPWTEVLRSLLRLGSGGALRDRIRGTEVARIVPELRSDSGAPTEIEWDCADISFRLFDATASVLRDGAAQRPLLIILDDLHWADPSSVLLLDFLAQEMRQSALLLIGIFRDGGGEVEQPTAAALRQLGVHGERISLGALSKPDIAELIFHKAGSVGCVDLVDATLERTGGNALFVRETIDMLARDGRLCAGGIAPGERLPVPDRVRDIIRQRLRAHSESERDMLAAAAVIGREFELPTLYRVLRAVGVSSSDDSLLAWIDAMRRSGILEDEAEVPSGLRFSHDLMRDTIYEELPLARRTALHASVCEALMRVDPGDDPARIETLAYHSLAALPGGDAETAVHFQMRAAQHAIALCAYESAAQHFERALHVAKTSPANEMRRCDLLLGLGEAQTGAGRIAEARAAFAAAARIAREIAAPDRLAHAALGFGGERFGTATGAIDRELISLLKEALSAVGLKDDPSRARLLARLGVALLWSDEREERRRLCGEALGMARRCTDAATLAYVLSMTVYAESGPDTVEQRLAAAREIIDIAERSGRRSLALSGLTWRATALLQLGQRRAADTAIAELVDLANQLRQPIHLWSSTALLYLRCLIDGQLGRAEEFAQQALSHGQKAAAPHALGGYAAQIVSIRWEQGRDEEAEALMHQFIAQAPALVIWRCGLARHYAAAGRHADARREVEPFFANDLRDLQRGPFWFGGMALLCETVAALADAGRAALLYERLQPYEDQHVLFGSAVGFLGSAAYFLGLLATTLQRWEEAERLFVKAARKNSEVCAQPCLARTQLAHARLLLARPVADVSRAAELLQASAATARGLGMARLAGEVEAELAALVPARAGQTHPESCVQPVVADSFLRREGEYWSIGYEGRVVRLKDAKGLRYVANLVREPGRPFHVFDLLAGELIPAGRSPSERTLVEDGLHISSDPWLEPGPDHRARLSYRQRVEHLREQLEEAEGFGDGERAGRLRVELDFVAGELADRYNPRIDGRRRSGEVERARKAVANRIRHTLRKLEPAHAALWRHLRQSIRTGTFCAYEPERRLEWDVASD